MSQQLTYKIEDRLYLNIMDRCTLRCTFCPKNQDNPACTVHDYDLTLDHRPSEVEMLEVIGQPDQYSEVVFCGFGEPALRLRLLLKLAQGIKEQGGRVRVNTDGLANLVHRRNVLPELAQCMDALSVSMNAQNRACYDQHCRPSLPGSYEAMLTFLQAAPAYVKTVTATAIDGLEGVDIKACEALALSCGVAFKRRELGKLG